jgi:hypothetical protein
VLTNWTARPEDTSTPLVSEAATRWMEAMSATLGFWAAVAMASAAWWIALLIWRR